MLAAKRNRSQLKKKALGKSKNLVVKEKCSQQKKQTNPPPPPQKKKKKTCHGKIIKPAAKEKVLVAKGNG